MIRSLIKNSNNIIIEKYFQLILKIYTKTGDDGTTGLQGNLRIKKSHTRIIAYGAIDEANAALGITLTYNLDKDIKDILIQIQNELFILGADLSNPKLNDKKNRISNEMTINIEKLIDKYELELPPLLNFILPGGDISASQIHLVRAIIRRAETFMVLLSSSEKINEDCLKYVNRLSDLFFVLGRVLNKRKGIEDKIWKPGKL